MKTSIKKKLIAMITIVAMLTMSFATSVLGATISIVNPTEGSTATVAGRTFNAYQVFTITPIENTDSYVYTIVTNPNWVTFFKNSATFDSIDDSATDFDAQVAAYIEGLEGDASAVEALAREMYDYIVANSIPATETQTAAADATSVSFSNNLTAGYYLISDETNVAAGSALEGEPISAVMLNNYTGADDDTVTITLKADSPTIEKEIVNEDSSTSEASTANIGDKVDYKITSSVPDMTGYDVYKFVITDTLSSGLEYDTTTDLVIKIGSTTLTKDVDYTLTMDTPANGFTLTIGDLTNISAAVEDAPIVVTYSAIIQESASTGNTGNANTVKLTYSNDPTNSGSGDTDNTTDTPDEIVITYVSEIKITKENDAQVKLENATFVLKDDNDVVLQTLTTDDTGIISFTGLEAGTYYIEETAAPSGYNLLEGRYKVVISYTAPTTVDDIENVTDECEWTYTWSYVDENDNVIDSKTGTDNDNGVWEVTVINKAGGLFPETGGMGTTIFMVVGGALMLIAVALFALKKRANSK